MSCCSNYEDIKITIENIQGTCEHNLKKGMTFLMKDLIPGGLCVHAYNVAFPYGQTLLKDGWFLWVKENEGVIAQCPNPDCSLVMEIKREEESAFIRAIQIRGDCTNKHKVGDVFRLNPKKMKICLEIFQAIYPPATLLHYQNPDEKRTITIRTKTQTADLTLKIERLNSKKALPRP